MRPVIGGPSVEVPVPLWASAAGLAGGVVFCGLAAVSTTPFAAVALLSGAAAAGGVGVYGLLERLARRTAPVEWAEGGEARALIDEVDEPMAVVDRFGAVLAANAAARHLLPDERPPTRAVEMLGDAEDPEKIVYRLLGAALGGHAAETEIDTGPSGAARISAWPIGGGLALWRRSPMEGAPRPPARAASAPRTEAPLADAPIESAEIGWFRLDAAGRIIESDRIFRRWLGSRSGRGVDAPPLRTVLPEANRPQSGADAGRSRLIGAPGAPREVAYVIAPLGRGDERVGVASPAALPAPDRSSNKAQTAPASADLFEAAPFGMVLLDAEGRMRRANVAAERMFLSLGRDGPAAGESGDYLSDWVAEKDADQVRRAFAAAQRGARGPETTRIVEWAERPDDAPHAAAEPREVEIAFRPHAGGEDGKRDVVAFLQDASERRGLERNVAQAQKLQAVGELAGGVAHDFNNMLTVIMAGCETLIARKTHLDPDVEELGVINQSALRAATLVSQLLAYSRKQRLEPTVANLTDLMSDHITFLSRLLKTDALLLPDLEEQLWPVLVDRDQLRHAVTNLVKNAADAMGSGGKIIIRTANTTLETPHVEPQFTIPPGDYVRLDVVDEGPGVPPDIQAKIFEPFFTTKKVGQGTGLGLSMVYGMVKQSQGYLRLESVEGEGASFSIYLPRASEAAVAAAEAAARAAEEEAEAATTLVPGDKIILLVEDESAVRAIAAKELSLRGYEVIEAADGTEALEILEDDSVHIDLMLSDVVMPDLDGPSLLKELGSRRPEMRTVFMTGYARDNFAETLQDGFSKRRFYGVLQKPFSLEDLRNTVARALGAEQPHDLEIDSE